VLFVSQSCLGEHYVYNLLNLTASRSPMGIVSVVSREGKRILGVSGSLLGWPSRERVGVCRLTVWGGVSWEPGEDEGEGLPP
jgi:hypothetical protein